VRSGIPVGVTGGLRTDLRMRVIGPQGHLDGIWAAGDCVQTVHRVSGQPVHVPLGTHANKQGRVAGINIGGGYATFPGVLGTAITRLCGTEVGRTGVNEKQAVAAGFDYVVADVDGTTTSGYMPEATTIRVKLLAERNTGRVLGGQIVGGRGSAKRIDVLATAITAGFDVQQVIDLDLGYAPPMGPLWDPIAVAARRALALL
jgi:NADPH-dependent 2,4-dienoyl-CoA reductase/sulfur reductase-like enzyme